MEFRTTLLGLTAWATASLAAAAGDRILVPVLYSGAGANGTSWAMEVLITNRTDQALELPGLQIVEHSCPIPEGCLVDSLPPLAGGFIVGPMAPAGFLLSLPDAANADLDLSARVAANARWPGTAGSELPLPSTDDFQPVVVLRGVPFEANSGNPRDWFRTWLRVYSLPEERPPTVTVKLRSKFFPDAPPFHEATFTLSEPGESQGILEFPGYRSLLLSDVFAHIGSTAGNIEIEALPNPDGSVSRIWAFASSVAESSGEVTVVRPARAAPAGD